MMKPFRPKRVPFYADRGEVYTTVHLPDEDKNYMLETRVFDHFFSQMNIPDAADSYNQPKE